MRLRTAVPLLAAVALALPGALTAGLSTPAAAARATEPLVVEVLSNRADLVSAGDVLVAVDLPAGVDPRSVKVTLGSRDVTNAFKVRPNGAYEGLLTGLVLGPNVVRATAPGYAGTQTVTNHPNGGPVFAGPQLSPYQCQATALDAQCNQPATYSYLYKSTDPTKPGPPGVRPHEPAVGRRHHHDRPREDGAVRGPARGRLPGPRPVRDPHPVPPRQGLEALGGAGAVEPQGARHPRRRLRRVVRPRRPRLDDYSGTIPTLPGFEQSYVTALGKGFAVVSTALNNTGHQCNLPQEAESMMMVKERVVEQYGPIRYTIGTGCSGGSIAQHTIANAYPGIYQGLVTTCSYPDTLTAGAQFADYHLLRLYFEDPSRWATGVLWSPTQIADVEGHLSHVNAVAADEGLFKEAINPESECSGTRAPVAGDRSTRFDSATNPGGVRCSILDMMINTLGPRPQSTWTTWEKQAGHGFAGVPFANVGVQYGLEALKQGQITVDQFVDLNSKVGGLDLNADPVAQRIQGDPLAITNVYRSGLVNEASHMGQVAIINHGGPDPGIAHDYSHAFWTEDRLMRAQGHTDNRVMWFGNTPLIGDPRWAKEALLAMDRWLTAVEKDRTTKPLARKIVDDKPADITDRCEDVPGVNLVGTPGEQVAACRSSSSTWARRARSPATTPSTTASPAGCGPSPARTTRSSRSPSPTPSGPRCRRPFPQGVCDYSRPGQGQAGAQTWLQYGDADTPVYGGKNLPAPPTHSGTGWSSASFRSLLRH